MEIIEDRYRSARPPSRMGSKLPPAVRRSPSGEEKILPEGQFLPVVAPGTYFPCFYNNQIFNKLNRGLGLAQGLLPISRMIAREVCFDQLIGMILWSTKPTF